jgi:dihydrodipicolinate synthase/N-acetylneuraminate lyase
VELTAWFRALLDAAPGPVLLYNIPMTTHVSIPLEVIGELLGHPRLVGLKDSENDPQRHAELLRRFGGRSDFSIFVGVGALMAQGLKWGADGTVPSVGNLIPAECQQQVEAARRQDWVAVEASAARQSAVAALYQNGHTLAQSLAVLKGLLHLRGLCSPAMFPPLLPVSPSEIQLLRGEAAKLHLA